MLPDVRMGQATANGAVLLSQDFSNKLGSASQPTKSVRYPINHGRRHPSQLSFPILSVRICFAKTKMVCKYCSILRLQKPQVLRHLRSGTRGSLSKSLLIHSPTHLRVGSALSPSMLRPIVSSKRSAVTYQENAARRKTLEGFLRLLAYLCAFYHLVAFRGVEWMSIFEWLE